MLARSTVASGIDQCRRVPVVRVDVHLSYRRVLHECTTTNHRRVRSIRAQLTLYKTSRDPRASLKAKKAIKLSMASYNSRFNLPRILPRPELRHIDAQTLREACPELTGVPDSFVRTHLVSMAPQMLAGVENAHIIRGTSMDLPDELPVAFRDNGSMPNVAPTHILALSTPNNTPQSASLFLIHQLPFAASCISFPALPVSATATPMGNRSSRASLPVVSASIPSVDAFPLFQIYLYVKNVEALRETFLPSGWMYSMESIMERVVLIKGFWANACAFGTVDHEMYDVIEECWAEVLGALEGVSSP